MVNPPRKGSPRTPLEYRLVALQALVIAGTSFTAAIFGGPYGSLIAGGCCAILPNAWMAWRIRRKAAMVEPQRAAARVVGAAVEKLVLMTLLLALALQRIEEVNAPAFFAGFIVALATHHVAFALTAGDD